MDSQISTDKQSTQTNPATVRMVGEADVRLVRDFGRRLGPGARLLELGPFLGGVSRELARFGALTVVDRFTWSEANARDYPGIATAGRSFRPVLEANLARAGVEAEVVEADFRHSALPEGPFDLCFIDIPRTAAQLLLCLRQLVGRMAPRGVILLKHGVSTAHPGMVALVGGLLARGHLELAATDQPAWCTIAALRVTPRFDALAGIGAEAEVLEAEALSNAEADPWGGARFQLARIAERMRAADWPGAFALLDQLAPGSGRAAAWDEFEAALAGAGCDGAMLAVMAEVLAVQVDLSQAVKASPPIGLSPVCALRGYWRNNAGQPWRAERFDPQRLAEAQAAGAMALPQALTERLRGREVVEIGGEGAGAGALAGPGFLAAGVASYAAFRLGADGGLDAVPSPGGAGLAATTPDQLKARGGAGRVTLVAHAPAAEAARQLAREMPGGAETLVVAPLPEGDGWQIIG